MPWSDGCRHLATADKGISHRRHYGWQKELVFKLFKSEGGLERTQARKPWRVVAEQYAKLLR